MVSDNSFLVESLLKLTELYYNTSAQESVTESGYITCQSPRAAPSQATRQHDACKMSRWWGRRTRGPCAQDLFPGQIRSRCRALCTAEEQ